MEIIYTSEFKRNIRQLAKKYPPVRLQIAFFQREGILEDKNLSGVRPPFLSIRDN